MPHILLADDDADLLRSLELLLSNQYTVHTATSVPKAKAVLANVEIDAAVVDLNFEGQEDDGLKLIDHILELHPDTPVIVLSGDQVTRRVVEATRRPLIDFIPKPTGEEDYDDVLLFALERGIQAKARSRQPLPPEYQFITKSPKVLRLLMQLEKILKSPSQGSILILGESGSGKEVLAKHIAARLGKPLRAVNMANIGKDRAESELFGHVKGAFTGAVCDKPGLIEQAHQGLFFLDEIGECTMEVQTKLLRVLQEGEILPVGAVKPKKIQVRFLAATNQNLQVMVDNRTFRLDLLQRINTFVLRLPPLRERPEDVLHYANMFLEQQGASTTFHFHSSGIEALLEHLWPGNVRELSSVISRIVALSSRYTIDGEIVREAIQTMNGMSPAPVRSRPTTKGLLVREQVLHALEKEQGNRARAAQRLGVHPTTLFRWIRSYGLTDVVRNRPGRPATRFNLDSKEAS